MFSLSPVMSWMKRGMKQEWASNSIDGLIFVQRVITHWLMTPAHMFQLSTNDSHLIKLKHKKSNSVLQMQSLFHCISAAPWRIILKNKVSQCPRTRIIERTKNYVINAARFNAPMEHTHYLFPNRFLMNICNILWNSQMRPLQWYASCVVYVQSRNPSWLHFSRILTPTGEGNDID